MAFRGLLATDGDIPGVIEFATGFDPGQPQRAAVGGRNTLPDQGMAVYGECRGLGDSPGANMFGDPPMRGFLAGTDFVFQQPVGAYGEATNGDRSVGVMGYSGVASTNKVNGPTGVLGTGTIGVRGETGTGVGVLGRAFDPSGQAGVFMGSVKVTGAFTAASISVSGTIEVPGVRERRWGCFSAQSGCGREFRRRRRVRGRQRDGDGRRRAASPLHRRFTTLVR